MQAQPEYSRSSAELRLRQLASCDMRARTEYLAAVHFLMLDLEGFLQAPQPYGTLLEREARAQSLSASSDVLVSLDVTNISREAHNLAAMMVKREAHSDRNKYEVPSESLRRFSVVLERLLDACHAVS